MKRGLSISFVMLALGFGLGISSTCARRLRGTASQPPKLNRRRSRWSSASSPKRSRRRRMAPVIVRSRCPRSRQRSVPREVPSSDALRKPPSPRSGGDVLGAGGTGSSVERAGSGPIPPTPPDQVGGQDLQGAMAAPTPRRACRTGGWRSLAWSGNGRNRDRFRAGVGEGAARRFLARPGHAECAGTAGGTGPAVSHVRDGWIAIVVILSLLGLQRVGIKRSAFGCCCGRKTDETDFRTQAVQVVASQWAQNDPGSALAGCKPSPRGRCGIRPSAPSLRNGHRAIRRLLSLGHNPYRQARRVTGRWKAPSPGWRTTIRRRRLPRELIPSFPTGAIPTGRWRRAICARCIPAARGPGPSARPVRSRKTYLSPRPFP